MFIFVRLLSVVLGCFCMFFELNLIAGYIRYFRWKLFLDLWNRFACSPSDVISAFFKQKKKKKPSDQEDPTSEQPYAWAKRRDSTRHDDRPPRNKFDSFFVTIVNWKLLRFQWQNLAQSDHIRRSKTLNWWIVIADNLILTFFFQVTVHLTRNEGVMKSITGSWKRQEQDDKKGEGRGRKVKGSKKRKGKPPGCF